ncbi:MAG: hypothetical protein J7M26_02355, partial [Armatimonadetes bacterium]|nr:hypothetical protein [Armatimonadota bacterium]
MSAVTVSLLILALSGLPPAGAGGPTVAVVSPALAVSASVVVPFVKVAPLTPATRAPAAAVVWVAAECSSLTEAQVTQLDRLARAGATVVVEDAPRLARGALAADLGLAGGEPSPGGASSVSVVSVGHPAVRGIPVGAWRVPCPAKLPGVTGGRVVLKAAEGWPVLWVRQVGKGKVVGVAAQRSAWRTPAQAVGYEAMITLLLAASARADNSLLAEVSARAAFRAWMYLGLPAGQARYRLRAELPDDYSRARRLADEARRLARTNPGKALTLADEAAGLSVKVAQWAQAYWRKVPVETLRMVAEKQGLLLCPGTLDFLHCMNLSAGAPAMAPARPAFGREAWLDSLADNPPGPALGYWRGLRPLLVLTAELPISVNPALRQQTSDGSRLGAPAWAEPQVLALLEESVPPVKDGTLVFYSRGQPWLTASCNPRGDYSPAVKAAFREEGKKLGLAEDELAEPPGKWEPSARWLAWQRARATNARTRWKALAEAVKGQSPSALLAVDAGYLGDPLHAGLARETGAEYVDCLAPTLLANYRAGFDPADLVAALRQVASLADADADGAPDRWPGCVARFRWSDALSLAPEAHELVGALALACGARGVFQTVAESGDWADAAAVVPEDVYARWEASFAPAVRAGDLWQQARVVSDALVWESFSSAAMARPDDEAERAAGLRAAHWGSMLARLGYVPRFVCDQEVTAGHLPAAGVLAVPSVLCAGQQAVATLDRFVRQGGCLVLGPGSLSFDAYHRPWEKKPAFLSGVNLATPRAEAEVVSLGGKGELLAATASPGGGVGSVLRRSGKVLGWAWSVGQGKVVYLATDEGD